MKETYDPAYCPRHFAETLPPMQEQTGGTQTIAVPGTDQVVLLESDELALLSLCTGWRTLDDLATESGQSGAQVERMVRKLADRGLLEPAVKTRQIIVRRQAEGDYRGLFAVLNAIWATLYYLDPASACRVELLDGEDEYWNELFEPMRDLVADDAPVVVVQPGHYPRLSTRHPELIRDQLDFSVIPERIATWPSGRRFQAILGDTATRQRIHGVISTYIRPRKSVTSAVDEFVSARFGDVPIIGAHLRATNHIGLDLPSEQYIDEFVLPEIRRIAGQYKLDDYRVLVASHVEEYVDCCRRRLGESCITRAIPRNRDPATKFNTIEASLLDIGRDVLFDCLLLARCDYLLGIPSNVLLAALMFNPNAPLKIFDFAMDRTEGWKDKPRVPWVRPAVRQSQ
jgi:hypothetical protein